MAKLIFTAFLFFAGQALGQEDYDPFLDEAPTDLTCENILDYVEEYLELSTMDHTLLAMAVGRAYEKSFPEEPLNAEEQKNLKEDFTSALKQISDNQMSLSNRAGAIQQILPSCLK